MDHSLSPVVLVYSDIAFKTSTLFSPAFLRKEFFPRMKRVVDAWHEHGVKCIFHSDGNLMGVLDDLVATGVDGLNPLEPLAGMDLKTVRERYPDLILMGNIDCSELLPRGTVAEVEAAVRKAIDDVAGSGGYILSSSSELHPGCKTENCIAMIETGKAYGRYPREA